MWNTQCVMRCPHHGGPSELIDSAFKCPVHSRWSVVYLLYNLQHLQLYQEADPPSADEICQISATNFSSWCGNSRHSPSGTPKSSLVYPTFSQQPDIVGKCPIWGPTYQITFCHGSGKIAHIFSVFVLIYTQNTDIYHFPPSWVFCGVKT